MLAQLAMTRAYGQGKTMLVGSLQFSAVVFASILGTIFFNDPLSTVNGLGIGVIVVSGAIASILTSAKSSKASTP